jgi:ASC-1-like (ASCH) protein
MITCCIGEPWFFDIKSGKKTVDLRLCEDEWIHLQPGKEVHMIVIPEEETEDSPPSIYLDVVTVTKFKTFTEALLHHGVENLLPDVKTVEEGVKIYEYLHGAEKDLTSEVVCFTFEIN